MGTSLGDFLRSRRDATPPEAVGRPRAGQRRVPGLRRSELAALAGISVEYLVRIEQGRDRNPSSSVVNALADALRLDAAERAHLRHLTKVAGGTCVGARATPGRAVRPGVRRLLAGLEPEAAVVTNRLGELIAYTDGFRRVALPTGLLDHARPNLTRFVFADGRARSVFPDWGLVADEQVFALSCSPVDADAAALRDELGRLAGDEFTGRLTRHLLPQSGAWRWRVPGVGELRWDREVLELPPEDAQQLVVLLPADRATADALASAAPTGEPALHIVDGIG